LLETVLYFSSPIEKTPFYMLVETSGSNYDHDEEKVNRFLQKLMDAKLILDGIVTNEPRKMKVCMYMKHISKIK
jgi:hypothetical protein